MKTLFLAFFLVGCVPRIIINPPQPDATVPFTTVDKLCAGTLIPVGDGLYQVALRCAEGFDWGNVKFIGDLAETDPLEFEGEVFYLLTGNNIKTLLHGCILRGACKIEGRLPF